MLTHFRMVGVIGKPDADRLPETLSQLCQVLKNRGLHIMLEQECATFIALDIALDLISKIGTIAEIGASCDLVVIIGGDGTLLTAARNLAHFGIPLIGVNLGRLGFLVDISPVDLPSRLNEMLDGHFVAEERTLLCATIIRNGYPICQQTAINEVVIHSWNATSMIEIETFINGVFLNSQRSDGLIVSTPTGSTAYALSAGGPILSPTLKAMVLAPVNPHTLTNRPIVVDDDSVIHIAFRPCKQFKAQVVCDNVLMPEVEIYDRIEITKETSSFRILHPLHYDFFEILRVKLHWSSGYRP